MSDSESFTSLMALVDSHLSKTSMQASSSGDGENHFPKLQLPSLTGGPNETQSESRLYMSPGQRLPLPTLSLSDSPIQEVLALQVHNMLKAKEKKKRQEEEARLAMEQQKLAEQMKQLKMEEENEGVIDLVKAMKESMNFRGPEAVPQNEETLSGSSSFESLFEPKFGFNESPVLPLAPEPLLPCNNDMSYILSRKIRRGRCSAFGKVLSSRLRPVAAPYLIEKVHSNIVPFDFATKSPCDLIRERLRKPYVYTNRKFDLFSIFTPAEEALSL